MTVFKFTRLTLLAALSLTIASSTFAATATWTPTAAETNSWNTPSNPPWDTGIFPNGIDDVANLNNNIAGAQTINLSAPITIGTLEIGDADSTHAFTLQNGTGGSLTFDVSSGSAAINRSNGIADTLSASITLADNLVITTTATGTLQLSGVIGESGGSKSITKNGSGRINLNAVNTFTGSLIINEGLVAAGNAGALNANHIVTFGPGTTTGRFAINNFNVTVGGLNTDSGSPGNAIVDNTGAAARTLTVANNVPNTFSGLLQNGGAGALNLVKAGTSTLTLNGSTPNTYTGSTRVNGGTLTVDFANLPGSTDLLNSASALLIAGGQFRVLGDSIGITSQTMASLRLLGGDSKLTVDANGGAGTTLTFTSSTIQFNAASVGDIILVGSAQVNLPALNTNDIYGAFLTFGGTTWARNNGSGVVEGLASYLTTSAAGGTAANYAASSNVDVTSSPTMDGPVAVNTLRFNSAAPRTITLTGSNSITSGGILVTSNVGSSASKVVGGSISGNTPFPTATGVMVTQNNTAGELEIASDIVDNVAGSTLNKSGPGTLKLSSTSNSYTGVTFIGGGTLKLGASGVIPDASRVDFPKPTGALDLNGFDETIDALSAEGGIITNSSAFPSSLTTSSATNTTYAGSLQNGAGTVALVKAGTSVLTLTGASTHTGGTTVTSGTLRVNNNSALGAGTLHLAGGTFDNGAAVTLANPISVATGIATNVISTTGSLTLTGPITGDGFFQNNGTASLTTRIQGKINGFFGTFDFFANPSGNNLFFDGTDPDSQDGSNARFVLNGAATRDFRFGSPSGIFKMGELSGTGGAIRNQFAGPHTLEIGHLNTTSTYSGVISNGPGEPVSLAKVGSGTLSLTGVNAYTGNTSVDAGTLSLAVAYLADGADVEITSGAILDLVHPNADDVRYLYLNGIPQPPGLYGASGLQPTYFSGAGFLNVLMLGPSPAHPGDFDSDGDVDGADFVAWQTNFPTATGAMLDDGDADGDGDVDGADFVVWQTNFPFTPGPGASPVPEPASGILLGMFGALAFVVRRELARA